MTSSAEPPERTAFYPDAMRLALVTAAFAILGLVGATLLVAGFSMDGGIAFVLLGGFQTFACSFVLGIVLARWRRRQPYLIVSADGIQTPGGLVEWSAIRSAELDAVDGKCELVLELVDADRPPQRIDLAPLVEADWPRIEEQVCRLRVERGCLGGGGDQLS